eukprot:superscaffoldBa00003602_g17296
MCQGDILGGRRCHRQSSAASTGSGPRERRTSLSCPHLCVFIECLASAGCFRRDPIGLVRGNAARQTRFPQEAERGGGKKMQGKHIKRGEPGLKHENPSAISLKVCEPADPGAAERSPQRRSREETRAITSFAGLDVFETKSRGKESGFGSAVLIEDAPTNKQRGDLTAQNKSLPFETVGV